MNICHNNEKTIYWTLTESALIIKFVPEMTECIIQQLLFNVSVHLDPETKQIVMICIPLEKLDRSKIVNMTYDRQVDAMYIEFNEQPVTKTYTDDDAFIFDLDAQGYISGLEILFP
jgi:Protein of unknown function (DUF2283)